MPEDKKSFTISGKWLVSIVTLVILSNVGLVMGLITTNTSNIDKLEISYNKKFDKFEEKVDEKFEKLLEDRDQRNDNITRVLTNVTNIKGDIRDIKNRMNKYH